MERRREGRRHESLPVRVGLACSGVLLLGGVIIPAGLMILSANDVIGTTEVAFGAGTAGNWVAGYDSSDVGTFTSIGDYKLIRSNVQLVNGDIVDTSHVHMVDAPLHPDAVVDGQLGDAFGSSLTVFFVGLAVTAALAAAALALLRRAWWGKRDRQLASIAKVQRILLPDEVVDSVITATTDANAKVDNMMIVATNQRILVFAMTTDRIKLNPDIYPRTTRLGSESAGTFEIAALEPSLWIRDEQVVAARKADAALDRRIDAAPTVANDSQELES